MTTFKAGDKVILVNPDRYVSRYPKALEKLSNNTLVVNSVSIDGFAVFAGLPGKKARVWHSKDLALAYEDWEAPSFDNDDPHCTAQKPKSLRRGDLVIYDGDICVVLSKFDGDDGDYVVASMTREPYYCWPKVTELTHVGSIRKKIKKIKNLTGAGK